VPPSRHARIPLIRTPLVRIPPDRTPLIRIPVILATAGLALSALAGCGQVNSALARQWAVVNFRPDTTVATVQAVRRACSDVPGVRPVRMSDVDSAMDVTYAVRYQVGKTSAANLTALRTCLSQFNAVVGVAFQDVANVG
jgi:hypothetical protein